MQKSKSDSFFLLLLNMRNYL